MTYQGSPSGAGTTDDDLATYRALREARRAAAQDLKRDPATLARGLDPGYRMRPHLRVIGDAMRGILVGEYDRLLILTPPQVGKSTTVAEWGGLWWFANRPTDDVIVASYGADLAVDRSKGIRARIVEYGADFDLYMQPGSEAAHDWQLTTGGHLRAVGVGGGLTGHPANLIIVDDPTKDRAEAESPTFRKALHDWWSSTASSRLQPDMGSVIAIQTRWHEDDFAGRRLATEGRLEEGGRWKVVHLPAIADPRYGVDPIGRAPGDPLTHPKIPTRDRARLIAWWADKKRTTMVRDWFSLYQGDPQPPSGALATSELLERIRQTRNVAEPERIAVAVDPSGGGRDSAGIIGGYLGDDGRLWITHDRSGVMDASAWSTAACQLAYETDAVLVFVETNYGGDMATLAIRTAWAKLQADGTIPADEIAPMVKAVRAKQGKLLRAEPIAQQMIQDRVRLLGIMPELEHEWMTWQPTDVKSPGRIDASVYLAYGLLPIPTTGASFALPTGRIGATTVTPVAAPLGGVSSLGPLG